MYLTNQSSWSGTVTTSGTSNTTSNWVLWYPPHEEPPEAPVREPVVPRGPRPLSPATVLELEGAYNG